MDLLNCKGFKSGFQCEDGKFVWSEKMISLIKKGLANTHSNLFLQSKKEG